MGPPRLFQSIDVDEQWHTVIAPWLTGVSREAWQDVRPTVILTPGRAESFYLRGRWLEQGGSFFGVHFWTPSDARRFLLGQLKFEIDPAREADLHLLARITAQRLAQNSRENTLASIVREPRAFLRAYELLEGAGWNPAQNGPAYSRKVALELQRLLTERKIAIQSTSHRLLFEASERKERIFLGHVLVAGFNATHWPLWDLLRAVTGFSEASEVSLLAPRVFAEAIDSLWIGSWENFAGPAELTSVPPKERPQPFSTWVGSYELGSHTREELRPFSFLVTSRLRTQTEAVVLQALSFLEMKSCRRLGIIFPEGSGLALGVAEELRKLGIPLNDGVGYVQPGPFERRAWSAWLDLQEEASVGTLIAWMRASEAEGFHDPDAPSAQETARALDSVLGETLIDNLDFLSQHLQEAGLQSRVADFLRQRTQLPESALFRDFRRFTLEALKRLSWSDRLPLQEIEAACPPDEIESELPRNTFLHWLREITDSRSKTRGTESYHYYGTVHLLRYAHLPGQTWTHLILTGLNEGVWPRVVETGAFGSRYELEQLNRQARGLNRRGIVEGLQGAGHATVRSDRGHCLLPLERMDLAQRDLCAAVEETREAVCLCALTNAGGRPLLPSDFFLQAYRSKTGSVLEESAFGELARQTEEEVARHKALFRQDADDAVPDIEETRRAYLARHDASQPSGCYEFSYGEPPEQPVQMPCKAWETAWNHPASMWLERVVGVAPWPGGELSWPLATGIWVHRWLASALHKFQPSGEARAFLDLLRAAADRERHTIENGMEKIGAEVYPWWKHVWGQARAIALSLGEELAPQLRDRSFFSEYPLQRNCRIALPGSERDDFELRGQVDLLLMDPGAQETNAGSRPDFTDASLWIVDFKTGSTPSLTESGLDKGRGLQAMLYALALEQSGAAAIALSLQTFDRTLRPQAQLSQVKACLPLFRSLDRMHRQGVFGMRPPVEGDYGHAPAFPLATLPIPADVLEAKWALAHGSSENFFEES